MKIYNYDVNGIYIGSSDADESPLEPGVFLLPANATDQEPPAVAEGEQAFFDGESWAIATIPPVIAEVEPVIATATPESVRVIRNALLSGCDWVTIKCLETGVALPEPWLGYRQALRDLPTQEGFPTVIDWPVAPEGM